MRPPFGEVGIHGVHRPREWDAVVPVAAPDAEGDELAFVALADGRRLVAPGSPATAPFAEALAAEVAPPYRALAVRRGDGRWSWSAAARRIEVVELAPDPGGDEIVLSVRGGERTLTVDGFPAFAPQPELERLGEHRGRDFVLRASRLLDALWEIQLDAL